MTESTTDIPILDDAAIVEIEARVVKASDGPWSQSALASAYIVGRHTDDFPVICALAEYKEDGTLHLEFNNAEANMAFLAHARQDIPALCQTVRAERERLAVMREKFNVSSTERERDLESQLEQVTKERDTARELVTRLTTEKQKLEQLK